MMKRSIIMGMFLIFYLLSSISSAQTSCINDLDCRYDQQCCTYSDVSKGYCSTVGTCYDTDIISCSQSIECHCGKVCDINTGECITGSARWYGACYDQLQAQWHTWGPIALLAVMVSFLIVAVAYMIGIGFNLRELNMWAKSEFYQAMASAALVVFLLSITYVMLDEGLAHIIGVHINPFRQAYDYLHELIITLEFWFNYNYAWVAPLEAAASLAIYQNAVGFVVYPLVFLKPLIIEPLHFINNYIIQVLLVCYMQLALLGFIQRSMFNVFLPLGVILRSFPPTRGAGAFMIAFAIGFFIVFPTVFSFILQMTEEKQELESRLAVDEVETLGVNLEEFNACESDFEALSEFAEKTTDPEITSKINQYASFLPDIIMKMVFFPMVIFGLTISFIRMLAPILGADISEIGRGLIKLI